MTPPCPPCVHSKRPRVCRHHAHMLKSMCACCWHTRGRFECTHGGVLNLHTGGEGSPPVPLIKKSSRRVLTWPEVHQRNPWILHNSSLRRDREQHVPDSSNRSLYLRKLYSSSNPEGNVGGNQLVRWLGLSEKDAVSRKRPLTFHRF